MSKLVVSVTLALPLLSTSIEQLWTTYPAWAVRLLFFQQKSPKKGLMMPECRAISSTVHKT